MARGMRPARPGCLASRADDLGSRACFLLAAGEQPGGGRADGSLGLKVTRSLHHKAARGRCSAVSRFAMGFFETRDEMKIDLHQDPGYRTDLSVLIPRQDIELSLLHIAHRDQMLRQPGLTRHRE